LKLTKALRGLNLNLSRSIHLRNSECVAGGGQHGVQGISLAGQREKATDIMSQEVVCGTDDRKEYPDLAVSATQRKLAESVAWVITEHATGTASDSRWWGKP
jgi:hypothetical protein